MRRYFDRVIQEARRKIPTVREQEIQSNFQSRMIHSETPGTRDKKTTPESNLKSSIDKPQLKSGNKKNISTNNQPRIKNNKSDRQKPTANKNLIIRKLVDKNFAVAQETIHINKRVVTSDKSASLGGASVQTSTRKPKQIRSQINSSVLSTVDNIDLNISETTSQQTNLLETKSDEKVHEQIESISGREKTTAENQRNKPVSDVLNRQNKLPQKPTEIAKAFRQDASTKQASYHSQNNHNTKRQNKGVHIGEVRVQIIEDKEILTSRRTTSKSNENNLDSRQLLRSL